jgi:hypothetical protein
VHKAEGGAKRVDVPAGTLNMICAGNRMNLFPMGLAESLSLVFVFSLCVPAGTLEPIGTGAVAT